MWSEESQFEILTLLYTHTFILVVMSLLTLLNIAGCVAGWEATYRLCSIALPRLYGDAATPKLKAHGGSYLVALIHAIIMAVRGTYHVLQLLQAPSYAKLTIPITEAEEEQVDEWYAATSATERTNLLFFSWVVYDLMHILVEYPNVGGLDTVWHHIAFLVCSFIAGTYGILPFAMAWLLVGETSTIPLNLRWILINTNRGDTPALHATNMAFAVSFFIVRCIIYGLGLFHLLWSLKSEAQVRVVLLDNRRGDLPRSFLYLVVALLVGGYGLNLMWFRKILAMAQRGKKPTKKE